MDYVRLIELCREKAEQNGKCIVVIDGRSASGKTTLAKKLSAELNAPVIHTDDFFLPPELRTEERYAEAGGNVHYERFAEEVLPKLISGEDFSYRRFDCGIMDYGEDVAVPANDIRIVEGAYSMHPNFGDYGDIYVFCDIDPEAQIERIIVRNGEEMAEKFRKIWIPFEEKYFDEYNIRSRADVLMK